MLRNVLTWSTVTTWHAILCFTPFMLRLITSRIISNDACINPHRRLLCRQSRSVCRSILCVWLFNWRFCLGNNISAAGNARRENTCWIDLWLGDHMGAADNWSVGWVAEEIDVRTLPINRHKSLIAWWWQNDVRSFISSIRLDVERLLWPCVPVRTLNSR